jgi:hypothetical protein
MNICTLLHYEKKTNKNKNKWKKIIANKVSCFYKKSKQAFYDIFIIHITISHESNKDKINGAINNQ